MNVINFYVTRTHIFYIASVRLEGAFSLGIRASSVLAAPPTQTEGEALVIMEQICHNEG